MNFQRLNHILIPTTKADRDRFRRTRTGRLFQPLFRAYLSLTEEGRFLSVFWIVCGAAGLEVGSTQIYLLWSALTGLLVASTLARRWFRLAAATAWVEPPERITAGDRCVLPVCVRNDGPRELRAIRVDRPLLPWDGRYVGPQPSIARIRPGETARAAVPAHFVQRGEHHLDPFHVARLVPFNLSQGSAITTGGARFLVVPRIARIERLGLPDSARYQPGGVAMASRTGESMEFVGLRPYRPGDRVRDIHARSWARVGEPVVREYVQEYFTRVGVVLDTDGTVTTEEALEAAVSLAAGVVARLSRGEALIDLLVVGDVVHRLTMGRHLGTLEQALDLLACVEESATLDPARIEEALAPHLPGLSCVVVVALAWDDARRAVVERIRRGGAGCRVLLVAEEAAADPAVTTVPPARIAADEGLDL